MLFYYENMPEDIACSMIENEKSNLEYIIKSYTSKRETFLSYTQKIIDGIQRVESDDYSNSLYEILAELKVLSKKISSLTASNKDLVDDLALLSVTNDDFSVKIEEYNKNMEIFQKDLISFLDESEEFIRKALQSFDFQFSGSNISTNKISDTDEVVAQEAQETPETQKNSSVSNSTNNISEFKLDVLEDNNCLLISEIQNKVFLPYKISDLEKQLAENPKKYSDIKQLIAKKYIISLSHFKNPVLARFKETFTLMKEKEDATFLEALDFALELSFNSNLNPAIIAACRNRNELDVYLDCLYEQELEQFKIFEIKYEINPILK